MVGWGGNTDQSHEYKSPQVPAAFSSPAGSFQTPLQQYRTPVSAFGSSSAAQQAGDRSSAAESGYYRQRDPRRETQWGFSPYRPSTTSASPSLSLGQGHSLQRSSSFSPLPWRLPFSSPPSAASSCGSELEAAEAESEAAYRPSSGVAYLGDCESYQMSAEQSASFCNDQYERKPFSGKHGDSAQQYLQWTRSKFIYEVSHHYGDPPLATLANIWERSLDRNGPGFKIYSGIRKVLTPVRELAYFATFGDRSAYLDPELSRTVLQDCTDAVRRKEYFDQEMEKLIFRDGQPSLFMVDKNRRQLLPVSAQQAAALAGSSSSAATDTVSKLLQQEMNAKLEELEQRGANKPFTPPTSATNLRAGSS